MRKGLLFAMAVALCCGIALVVLKNSSSAAELAPTPVTHEEMSSPPMSFAARRSMTLAGLSWLKLMRCVNGLSLLNSPHRSQL
jgi:hypothetical protein